MSAHRRAKADLGPGLGSFACVKGTIKAFVVQMDRGGCWGGGPDPAQLADETHIIPASIFGTASREGGLVGAYPQVCT